MVRFPLGLAALVAGFAACSDGASNQPDATSGPDARSDADPEATCTPTPVVAGTTATDALANAPTRCDAPAYSWRRDASLGALGERGSSSAFTAGQLTAIAAAADVILPFALEYDIATATIAYTTQDRGDLVSSSTAVVYPTNLPAGARPPVLLLLHGTSGFRRECGPTSDQGAVLLGALFASRGWVVAMPDYLGLESLGDDYPDLHPYLIGEPTAIASLDAARAALHVATEAGLCPAPELATFGGSQGGHAALWVERLAPYYAREFTMLGGVATVPPSDLVAHTDRALTSVVPATGNTLATYVTNAAWYGKTAELETVLVEPYLSTVGPALDASCDPGDTVEPGALETVFTQTLLDHVDGGSAATYPGFGCMTQENSLRDTSVTRIAASLPSYGMLFVLGQADTLVVPEIERASYDAMCAEGVPLSYLECAGASHTEATSWALTEIEAFLAARRDRVAFTPACTRPAAVTCSGTP